MVVRDMSARLMCVCVGNLSKFENVNASECVDEFKPATPMQLQSSWTVGVVTYALQNTTTNVDPPVALDIRSTVLSPAALLSHAHSKHATRQARVQLSQTV